MRAIVQDVYGSSDVLRMDEVETVEPAPRQVLVRVHAAGLDIGQWHMMTGTPRFMRLFVGRRAPRARIRGLELAGRVERVGARVTRFQPGDEVFGVAEGAFADFVVAREDKLAKKPASVSFEQAAAAAVSGLTAVQAVAAGRVRAGQRVLVLGAAGGVGSFATQIAATAGAHVTGVASTAKLDTVRALGADEVLDYTVDDVTDGTRHWDVIIDTGGNRPTADLRRALTRDGSLVIVGGEGAGGALGGFNRLVGASMLSPWVRHRLVGLTSITKVADLERLAKLMDAGLVSSLIDRTYPLAETQAAMRHLESGATRGKIVIAVG